MSFDEVIAVVWLVANGLQCLAAAFDGRPPTPFMGKLGYALDALMAPFLIGMVLR